MPGVDKPAGLVNREEKGQPPMATSVEGAITGALGLISLGTGCSFAARILALSPHLSDTANSM